MGAIAGPSKHLNSGKKIIVVSHSTPLVQNNFNHTRREVSVGKRRKERRKERRKGKRKGRRKEKRKERRKERSKGSEVKSTPTCNLRVHVKYASEEFERLNEGRARLGK
jgi:hypothetical protein